MRLALSITHAPWRKERVEAFNRVLASLFAGGGEKAKAAGVSKFHVETTPGPNWKWGEAQWQWALSTDCDVAVFLQDDTLVPDDGDFWPILGAMLEANPHRVFGFHTRHPEAQGLDTAGRRWVTTTEMVGTGYSFWLREGKDSLAEFMRWRDSVGAEWIRKIDEDTSIGGGWVKSTGRRIWHPIPTITDHDDSLASTAGNDDHPDRRPTVPWHEWSGSIEALKQPGFWRGGLEDAPHFILHHRSL